MILRNGAERGMGSLVVRSICFWEVASLVSFVGLGPGVFSQELSSFDTLYWLGLIPIFFTLSYTLVCSAQFVPKKIIIL